MANIDRFLTYVRINTQSDDTTGTTPSTECQKDLGKLLVKELKALGLSDAHMDKFGNVYGHLPGEGKTIGLNAHMDTALEVSGKDVNPRIITNYNGGIIDYPNGLKMNPSDFPVLLKHTRHDLVVTDGTTLLGGDDKAGIAIIMSILAYFHENPNVKHTNIAVCFTVDEEIGEGPLHFDYEEMGADFAYTIDGADIDTIEYENFNAYCADILVKGVSIHPGEGKNKLINAILVMDEILDRIPKNQTPFNSEGRQGFFHITSLNGSSEEMKAHLIIRDFDSKNIQKRISVVDKAVNTVKKKYPNLEISHSIKLQYENMRTYVDKDPQAVENAKRALKKNGIEPQISVIRGGTDGATFSKNGLITPNLGTASFNHHGRFEFLDINDFEKMIQIGIDLVKID